MFKLNTTRSYPQWRAGRITDAYGQTRWCAINDQNGVYRRPERPGKDSARALARELSEQERAGHQRGWES